MRYIALLLLLFALPAWATDTVVIDRDGVTQPLTLTPGSIGALKAADYKVKNVLALGVLNNGSDQGAAIQALLNAASAGDTFYFPQGTYGSSVKITLPQETSIRIIGDGPAQTTFKALASMTSFFYKAGGSTAVLNAEFTDFTIDCNLYAGVGMELQTYKQPKLNRLYIYNWTGDSALLLGKTSGSGGVNMFYEAQIDQLHLFISGGSYANADARPPYGIHLQSTASDNQIGKVVVAYAKTAAIFDEAYGNNTYAQIHPWGTPSYPTPYGIHVQGRASIVNSEFDTCSTAGVKVGSYGHVTINGNIFTNNTPTAVEIANGAPDVAIVANTYEGVTNKYTGTPGTGFTFTDGLTFGTSAGNLVQLDSGAKILSSLIPTLNQNTTGTAVALAANGTNCGAGQAAAGVDASGNAEGCFSPSGSVSDTAYGVGWDGDTTTAPSKNAVYDKFAALEAGGGMVYPGAGVPNSTGSAWGTSYTVGTGANHLVQLNSSSQLPAVSGALLTNLPSQLATSTVAIAPTTTGTDAFTLTRANPDLSVNGTYTTLSSVQAYSTAAPHASSQVRHFTLTPQYTGGGTLGVLTGFYNSPRNGGTGTVSTLRGFFSWPRNTSTGTLNYEVTGFFADSLSNSGTVAAGTTIAGFRANNQGLSGVTSTYGLKIEDQSGSTNPYAIYTGTGPVYHGDKVTAKSFVDTVKANGTCSTSVNIDPTLGGVHTLTLSGACAIGVTNLAAGQSFTLKLTQSSTTAPTFTSAYKWPAATPPTWSTSATKYDVLSCYSDDGTTLLCNGMVDVR